MRIIHMIGHLRLGAGRYIADVALEQARRRDNGVAMFTSPDAEGNWKSDPALLEELERGGVTVAIPGDCFHRDQDSLLKTASNIRSIEGKPNGDVVFHAHSGMAAVVARWARAGAVVCTCHGWNLARPAEYNLQDALAYQLCDAVTSPSRFWAVKLQQEMGVEEVDVVPVGLNLQRFPPPLRGPLGRGPLRIVAVGELTARKGFDMLLDAMPLVCQSRSDVELHIFGEGDMSAELRRRAESLAPAHQIRFHGFVRAPYLELPEYDIFCLPSRSDNLPVAVIEAMLARLPIVATDVGGIPGVVGDGECGKLIQPDSVPALAAGLAELIGMGAERRAALGEKGERFARNRFDVKRVVDELERVYASTLR